LLYIHNYNYLAAFASHEIANNKMKVPVLGPTQFTGRLITMLSCAAGVSRVD
jgi:hypothetical protein